MSLPVFRIPFHHRSPPPYKTGRGGGIRTPTLGFGDRWSTVEPTPLKFEPCSNFTLSPPSGRRVKSRIRDPRIPSADQLQFLLAAPTIQFSFSRARGLLT